MSHSASVRARAAHRAPRERALGSPASRAPRRVSGPVRRPVPAGSGPTALPTTRARPGTSAFDRIRALPDHRLVDGLLRSQAWIWVIGIALGGIVAMQVSLLKLNAGIGRAVEHSATLERQNAALELSVARLSSGERLERVAAQAGMVMPAAGSVEYVRVRPSIDPRWAAIRMQAPSPEARALMANGGVLPAAAPTTLAADPPVASTAATVSAPSATDQPVAPTAPTAAVPTAVSPVQPPEG